MLGDADVGAEAVGWDALGQTWQQEDCCTMRSQSTTKVLAKHVLRVLQNLTVCWCRRYNAVKGCSAWEEVCLIPGLSGAAGPVSNMRLNSPVGTEPAQDQSRSSHHIQSALPPATPAAAGSAAGHGFGIDRALTLRLNGQK